MNNIKKETIKFGIFAEISITEENNNPKTFPSHWHNALEFTIARKSGCLYKVEGNLYELEKGDVLLVWPQQIHETVNIPQDGALFTQFSSAILESNLDLVSMSKLIYECHHISASEHPELTRHIADRVMEIKDIRNSSDPFTETKCKLCIYDILVNIGEFVLRERKDAIPAGFNSGAAYRYIHEACNFIVENSTENITQKDVAEKIGISTFYFSKIFKSYMNMSFPAYLSSVRVRNATKLLSDANLSITECAFMSGFQSTTAFNKAFHELTGHSPREYRKLYR